MSPKDPNPFRAPEPEPESESIDFQNADDKPWLRSESRKPLLGPKLGAFLFVVVWVVAVVAATYFFGRLGGSLTAIIIAVLIKAGR